MKFLLGLLAAALILFVLLQFGILAVSSALHGQNRFDAEIAWLENSRPFMPLPARLDSRLERRYLERVRRALVDDKLDRAVHAYRTARLHAKNSGRPLDRALMGLGIECYTRAADRLEAHGRLSLAADWDDSLFVLAIRAPEPHHRYAALAAFIEGLDLRVRDGKPCAALARVEWARKGLGGEVPGLQASVEEDLAVQCRQSRRAPRRR